MSSNNKIIAGNWKMNGTVEGSRELVTGITRHMIESDYIDDVDVILCPSFVHMQTVREAAAPAGIKMGAQNCHVEPSGAYTGSISAEMVKDAGCAYVLTGHSERRTLSKERDDFVAKKSEAAIRAGMMPILCAGEMESTRTAGEHISVVRAQIKNSLPPSAKAGNFMLAYEPVWAIGTGKNASIADISEMHDAIRRLMIDMFGDAGRDIKILYGGSVKPENAYDILKIENVGGVLIGGASLKATDFNAIIDAGIRAGQKG